MAQQLKVDYGVYNKAPLLYFFRNGTVLALSALIVKEFKNAYHVKCLLENSLEQSLECQNFKVTCNIQCNESRQPESIRNKTLFEFLKQVHQKGKREEQKKKRKEGKELFVEGDDSSEQIPSTVRTLHLNNLNNNKDILSKILVSQLLDMTVCCGTMEKLKELDITFLLNLLTNDIVQFPLDDKIFEAVHQIKAIRNEIFHSGSNFEHTDMLQKLDMLYYATEGILSYLHEPSDDLKRIKQEFMEGSEIIPYRILPKVLEELKQEVHQSYALPKYSLWPSIMSYGMNDQNARVVENIENFLHEHKTAVVKDMQPIILCGAPGVGKTSILQKLANVCCENTEKVDFSLVLYLDTKCKLKKKPSFSQQVYESIKTLGPQTVSKYGIDLVKSVLNTYVDKILFLADWNIHCITEIVCDMWQGTWIVTYQGTPETPGHCCVLKVLPLNEAQVDRILRSIIPNEEQLNHILKVYWDCSYRGVLNSPDILNIFIEMGNRVSFEKMLQHFINSKVNIKDRDKELLKLGKTAFSMVKKNGKYYTDKDLSLVQKEARDPFLEYHCSKGATFKYRVIEDYLAARYVVAEPREACKIWLNQIPLFKRVFRFASVLWCMNEHSICDNLPFMKSYLKKLFDIEEPVMKSERTSARRKNEAFSKFNINDKREAKDDASKINCQSIDSAKEFSKSNFTKWSFIITFAEYCQYKQEVLGMLTELLHYKQSWHFKCKFLDERKIEKIALILDQMEQKKSRTIKVESGSNVKILEMLLKMLSTCRCLHDTSVQIIVVQKDSLPAHHKIMLKALSNVIAGISDNPLYITRYVGPLICSETPRFLKCMCLRKVEVLDVCVYDIASLRELLSCTGLSSLKDVLIRVDLSADEQTLTDTTKIVIPKYGPLALTIRYFKKLQDLLDMFDFPEFLQTLSIHDVYIYQYFRLDLSKFTGLICLFIKFIPELNSLDIVSECSTSQEYMGIDENMSNRTMLPPSEWTSILEEKFTPPKRLDRLLLRNMKFCSDSTSFLSTKYRDKYHIQRLSMIDSSLPISEVRKLLRSHTPDSNYENFEKVPKKPRLTKEERDEKRRDKPNGKELIITSGLGLCSSCQKFPCSCEFRGDSRETLKELVCLIQDAYYCNFQSFSFSNEVITVRKDLCGDLRVHCPLTCLKDNTIFNLENADLWLQNLFRVLTLAQHICLNYTDLTHVGAMGVVKNIKEGKTKYSGLGYTEQFTLTVMSTYHPKYDEIRNSSFIDSLKKQNYLVQFSFLCSCIERCHHVKKTLEGKILVNDEEI